MKVLSTSLICATAAMLAACGGGGGGGGDVVGASNSPPAAQAQDDLPPPLGGTLQATAAAPTYPSGSGELAAFNQLQKVRTGCGFGALNQNAKLDAASLAHVNYLLEDSSANTLTVGHTETPSNAFFTGARPQDRASAAGYGENVSEILSAKARTFLASDAGQAPGDAAFGLMAMQGLLNTVAHLSAAMSGARSVGLADGTRRFDSTQNGFALTTLQYRFGALLGAQEGTQLLGAGNVAHYPCAATQDAEYAFAPATEAPNPFPAITDTAALVGPPIYLRADAGALLKVDSFGMKTSSGTTVPVRTDVGAIQGHEFFMVPRDPLQSASVYTVNFKGSANGQAFDRTFSFRTRN
ncbi:hypothetical protein [Variovorax sp. UMC13]|uniref:hypothetical protein n=1 Tax=Variovorax sp. UMC13 TaxID=1862326 RepID=UPI00160186C0|nr:hypothetical protein [Variovorax sp. UMC13]